MPDRQVISNTSPLLYLHQVQRLEILQRLYDVVTIPRAVEQELAQGDHLGYSVPSVADIDWLRVQQVADPELLPTIVDLGAGEVEVIALGLENPRSLLVLDDQLGRRIASLNRLTLTGTLGVLVKAKKRGLLQAVRPVIEDLRKTSMHIHEDLVRFVLVEAGEQRSC